MELESVNCSSLMPFKFLLRTCSFFLRFCLLKTTATCLTNSPIEVGLSCRLPVCRTHEDGRTGVTRRHSPAWHQSLRNLTTLLLAFHVLRNLEAAHTCTHTHTHTKKNKEPDKNFFKTSDNILFISIIIHICFLFVFPFAVVLTLQWNVNYVRAFLAAQRQIDMRREQNDEV